MARLQSTSAADGDAPRGHDGRREWLPDLLVLLGLMAAATVLFAATDLDRAAQGLFFRAGAPNNGWFLQRAALCTFLRDYAAVPAVLTAAASLAVLVAGFSRPALARFRPHVLFLLVALAAGPGFVVNKVFKENWGRPRPVQVREYGGRYEFQPPLVKGRGGRCRSFPCGHSSVGYYLAAGYLVFRRRRPRTARWILAGALAYGSLLGAARMAAGAHFLSDVVWSALIVFAVLLVLYHFVFDLPAAEEGRPRRLPFVSRHPGLQVAVAVLFFGSIVAGVLMATPIYRALDFRADDLGPPRPRITVDIACERGDVLLSFADEPRLFFSYEGRGFGLPGSRFVVSFGTNELAESGRVSFQCGEAGRFSEADVSTLVALSAAHVATVRVDVARGSVQVGPPPPGRQPVLSIRAGDGAIDYAPGWEAPGPAAP